MEIRTYNPKNLLAETKNVQMKKMFWRLYKKMFGRFFKMIKYLDEKNSIFGMSTRSDDPKVHHSTTSGAFAAVNFIALLVWKDYKIQSACIQTVKRFLGNDHKNV